VRLSQARLAASRAQGLGRGAQGRAPSKSGLRRPEGGAAAPLTLKWDGAQRSGFVPDVVHADHTRVMTPLKPYCQLCQLVVTVILPYSFKQRALPEQSVLTLECRQGMSIYFAEATA
jgi:hypothetical protein